MIYEIKRNFLLLFNIHTTQYDGLIRICNMTDDHLANAIKLGGEGRSLYWKRAVVKFKAEVNRRNPVMKKGDLYGRGNLATGCVFELEEQLEGAWAVRVYWLNNRKEFSGIVLDEEFIKGAKRITKDDYDTVIKGAEYLHKLSTGEI